MRTLRLIAICAFSVPVAFGADNEFKEIVRSISDKFQTRPMHIPMFGLVNAFLFTVRPSGAKHLDLAVFEDLRSGDADPREFQSVIRNATAGRWAPFVTVTSRKNREQTFIYMRQEGDTCRLLIASLEPGEATVVQMSLSAHAVQRWLNEPAKSAWKRDGK